MIGYALTCDGCLRHFTESLWSGMWSLCKSALEEGWRLADNGAATCPDCQKAAQ